MVIRASVAPDVIPNKVHSLACAPALPNVTYVEVAETLVRSSTRGSDVELIGRSREANRALGQVVVYQPACRLAERLRQRMGDDPGGRLLTFESALGEHGLVLLEQRGGEQTSARPGGNRTTAKRTVSLRELGGCRSSGRMAFT
jgi:hypothetical protein